MLSRGHTELRLDATVVGCDAVLFREHLAANCEREALELYRGDFMEGFFISGCPDFEKWTDREQAGLKRAAIDAAVRLARTELSERPRDGEGARFARIAVDLAPHDETAARVLMRALDAAGDRAGALAAYRGFADRLRDGLGLEPAPETRALADELREERAGSQGRQISLPEDSRGFSATLDQGEGGSGGDADPLPAREHHGSEKGSAVSSGEAVASRLRPRPHRFRIFAYAGLAITAVALVGGSLLRSSGQPEPRAAPTINTLAIGEFQVELDPEVPPPADPSGLPTGVATRLSYLPSLTVLTIPGTSEDPAPPTEGPGMLDLLDRGADALLTGHIRASGNGVTAEMRITDLLGSEEIWRGSQTASWDDLPALEGRLALELATLLRPDEAEVEAERIRRRATTDVSAWDYVEQARRLSVGGGVDWARVEDLVDEALLRDAELAEAYAIRSYARYVRAFREGTQWLDSALASAERAVALDVNNYYGYERLGVVWAFRGDAGRSLAALLRSLELNPNNHRTIAAVGGVLGQSLGRLDLAWPWHQRAGLLNPDGASRFRSEGANRWRLGDYGSAESLLLRSLELNPQDYEALRRLAQLYLTQGRFSEARDFAGRMLRARPSRSESHSHAAMVEAWAGRPHEALDHLERGGRLPDAGGIVLTSGISWPTLRAFVMLGLGREPEARSLLARADSIARNQLGLAFAHAEYDLARIHALRGDSEGALEWLGTAIDRGWYFAHTYMGRRDPMLSLIHDDPEFDRLLSRAEAELDAQLEAVDRMGPPPDALEFQRVLAETKAWLEAGMPEGVGVPRPR